MNSPDIFTTKSMPNLIKVGFSRKDPELRALDMNNTGNPYPYKVEYDVLVNDPVEIEKKAHEILKAFHERKEWFNCSVELAIAAIRNAAKDKILLETLPAKLPLYKQHNHDRFIVNEGMATDRKTGLSWLRFCHGQTWKNGKLLGKIEPVRWQIAFEVIEKFNQQVGYAGYTDWRLPEINELKTLVTKKKSQDGYHIDTDIFPNNNPTKYVMENLFWSATHGSYPRTCAITGDYAHTIEFLTGQSMNVRYKYHAPKHGVRLVRGDMFFGQPMRPA